MLVVNEPELAEAINRLRGEWEERTGGELSASSATWAKVGGAKEVDADVVVFPARYLGEFCVRGWLRPVRPNVLESDALEAADFFPLVRHELINWGGQVMALPLGVDLPLIRDVRKPTPAVSLLAAAAPNAVSEDRIGVMFNPETMAPRITEPPFVEALAQLAHSSSNADDVKPTSSPSVPVLGFSDRLAGVTTFSRNAASAFKLLEWLAQPDASSQLARAGERMLPVRRSLASSPSWYDPNATATERAKLAKALETALTQQRCLLIPQIPGVDDYMAALDQAVRDAAINGVPPEAALQQAAKQWEQVTEVHGRDAQRNAYLKHLGIDEP